MSSEYKSFLPPSLSTPEMVKSVDVFFRTHKCFCDDGALGRDVVLPLPGLSESEIDDRGGRVARILTGDEGSPVVSRKKGETSLRLSCSTLAMMDDRTADELLAVLSDGTFKSSMICSHKKKMADLLGIDSNEVSRETSPMIKGERGYHAVVQMAALSQNESLFRYGAEDGSGLVAALNQVVGEDIFLFSPCRGTRLLRLVVLEEDMQRLVYAMNGEKGAQLKEIIKTNTIQNAVSGDIVPSKQTARYFADLLPKDPH